MDFKCVIICIRNLSCPTVYNRIWGPMEWYVCIYVCRVLEMISQLKRPVKFLLKTSRNPYVTGLFFDLTKAYDAIYNEILFTKLEYYGIRGTIEAWLESYLSYQWQFVEIFKTDNRRRNQQMYKCATRCLLNCR